MFRVLMVLGQRDEELSTPIAHLPTQATRKACFPSPGHTSTWARVDRSQTRDPGSEMLAISAPGSASLLCREPLKLYVFG